MVRVTLQSTHRSSWGRRSCRRSLSWVTLMRCCTRCVCAMFTSSSPSPFIPPLPPPPVSLPLLLPLSQSLLSFFLLFSPFSSPHFPHPLSSFLFLLSCFTSLHSSSSLPSKGLGFIRGARAECTEVRGGGSTRRWCFVETSISRGV